MGGVLLVDDVPGERANFKQAFGRDLTVAPSIDQLNEQLRRGLNWDLAFVDFNLSSQTSTGLTALLRLHHERPATKIVTYSQFTESGRTLYDAGALAAASSVGAAHRQPVGRCLLGANLARPPRRSWRHGTGRRNAARRCE